MILAARYGEILRSVPESLLAFLERQFFSKGATKGERNRNFQKEEHTTTLGNLRLPYYRNQTDRAELKLGLVVEGRSYFGSVRRRRDQFDRSKD